MPVVSGLGKPPIVHVIIWFLAWRPSPVVLMLVHRSVRINIAPKLFIAGNLMGLEQGARFEVYRQMHSAQAALQLGNGRRRGGE